MARICRRASALLAEARCLALVWIAIAARVPAVWNIGVYLPCGCLVVSPYYTRTNTHQTRRNNEETPNNYGNLSPI